MNKLLSLHTQDDAQKGEAKICNQLNSMVQTYQQQKTREGHVASRNRHNVATPLTQKETSQEHCRNWFKKSHVQEEIPAASKARQCTQGQKEEGPRTEKEDVKTVESVQKTPRPRSPSPGSRRRSTSSMYPGKKCSFHHPGNSSTGSPQTPISRRIKGNGKGQGNELNEPQKTSHFLERGERPRCKSIEDWSCSEEVVKKVHVSRQTLEDSAYRE